MDMWMNERFEYITSRKAQKRRTGMLDGWPKHVFAYAITVELMFYSEYGIYWHSIQCTASEEPNREKTNKPLMLAQSFVAKLKSAEQV